MDELPTNRRSSSHHIRADWWPVLGPCPNEDVSGGKIICGTIAPVTAARRVTDAVMAFKKTIFRRRASRP